MTLTDDHHYMHRSPFYLECEDVPAMTTLDAINIIDGETPCDDLADLADALQLLIDTGLASSLQGYYGRECARAIEAGVCHA